LRGLHARSSSAPSLTQDLAVNKVPPMEPQWPAVSDPATLRFVSNCKCGGAAVEPGGWRAPVSQLIYRNAGLAVTGDRTQRCHPGSRAPVATGGRTGRRGGSHVSGRTSVRVDRRIIRSLVRGYFCILVRRQAATQFDWETL